MYTLYEAVSYNDHHGVCHKLKRLRENYIFVLEYNATGLNPVWVEFHTYPI